MKSIKLMVIISIFCNQLYACDCILHHISKYVDTSEYILKVKTISLIKSQRNFINERESYKAKVDILKSYKGKLVKGDAIEFNSLESNCSFIFKKNKRYLLFCYRVQNCFYVYDCSYSDEIKFFSKRIRWVKKYVNLK